MVESSAGVGFGVTGAFVGLLEGLVVDFTGDDVGLLVGDAVGFLEGLVVDFTGDDVGFFEGVPVGLLEGLVVG